MGVVNKNKRGKKLKFKTPKELQLKIDEYFKYCDNRTKKIWKEKTQEEMLISDPAPYTMSGLARKLGLSRQALSEYSHRDKYGDSIARARQRVEEDVENRLMETKNEKGAIFNLKNNFGWREKTEIEQSGQFDINLQKLERIMDTLLGLNVDKK